MRKSNFEWLRILSMLAIILGHFSYHGQFALENYQISFNKTYLQIIQAGGDFGINCFVMISSYFMLNSTFNIEKVIKLIFRVWTYSIGVILLFSCLGNYSEGIGYTIKSFAPILSNIYWFATTYIVFYILTPGINILIHNINRNMHLKIVIICIILWCIIPTITPFELVYNELLWFITLYFIIAYIKVYNPSIANNKKQQISMVLVSSVFICLSVIILTILADKVPIMNEYINFFERRNRVPMLIMSLGVFLIFKNWNIKYNRFINMLASATFGVYLIHDNPIIRNFLWKDIFKNNLFINSKYLIVYSLSVSLIIFLIASIIDIIKQNIIDNKISVFFIRIIKKTFIKYFKRLGHTYEE